MKYNDHQCIIDYWGGIYLDANYFFGISGANLSFNVVHVDSVVINVLINNKQVEGK